jgi:site-specific DNA-methyltransferase (adenine-specific)
VVDLGDVAAVSHETADEALDLRVALAPIERLRPYAGNARTHSTEQVAEIAASMQEFGWTIPALVDEDGGLIAGHGRLLAAASIYHDNGSLRMASGEPIPVGMVPYLVARGWSPEQKQAYVLADNQLALHAGWDVEVLKQQLGELAEAGYDVGLAGFKPADLEQLFGKMHQGIPDRVIPPPKDPLSRPGDLWRLGDHRILCGDSTRAEDVARVLGGAKPHLMVTDPPYGVKYDPEWRLETGHGSAGQATGKVLNDDRADWREAWALFPGDVAYIWHAGMFCGPVWHSLEAVKFKIRAHIVWVKPRHVFGRGDYHFQHEPCLYAVRDGGEENWHFVPEHELAAYAVRDGTRGHYEGGRKQSTVWNIEHIKSETGHGTQKPVECMRRPIENNSRPGDAVYEPFSGSGTTIIACEMTDRVCYAIELNPAYVDVAVKRWEEFTGLTATLERRSEAA